MASAIKPIPRCLPLCFFSFQSSIHTVQMSSSIVSSPSNVSDGKKIKREISSMKLIRHPNVVHLSEVMARKTKMYMVLEVVAGGELFDKIANNGKLREHEARVYFQQLINDVDYCHSRGVFHRDLKPENLLLDANGNLKVSDFGLSALAKQFRGDGSSPETAISSPSLCRTADNLRLLQKLSKNS